MLPPRSLTFRSFWWSLKSLPLQMSVADSPEWPTIRIEAIVGVGYRLRGRVWVALMDGFPLCVCVCVCKNIYHPAPWLIMFFVSIPPATSDGTRQGLDSMRGGVCATQGMKVVLKVGQSKFLFFFFFFSPPFFHTLFSFTHA